MRVTMYLLLLFFKETIAFIKNNERIQGLTRNQISQKMKPTEALEIEAQSETWKLIKNQHPINSFS